PTASTSKNSSMAWKGGLSSSHANKKSFTSISSPVSSKNSLFKFSGAERPYSIPPPGGDHKNPSSPKHTCFTISKVLSFGRRPVTLVRRWCPYCLITSSDNIFISFGLDSQRKE